MVVGGYLRFGWVGVQVDVGDVENVVAGIAAILKEKIKVCSPQR